MSRVMASVLIGIIVALTAAFIIDHRELTARLNSQNQHVQTLESVVLEQSKTDAAIKSQHEMMKSVIESNNSKIDSLEKEVKSLR